MTEELGQFSRTKRDFSVIEFRDNYDCPCSVQHSSAIDGTERGYALPGSSYLWLGLDDALPLIMAKDAAKHGVDPGDGNGWVPYPIPEEVLLTTRMHLNRDKVEALINVLQRWLDTHSIEP